MDRYFSSPQASVTLMYDYAFSEDPNILDIRAKSHSAKKFETIDLVRTGNPPSSPAVYSCSIEFDLIDSTYTLKGYKRFQDMTGNSFYIAVDGANMMLNLQEAIANNFTLNGLFKTELIDSNRLRIKPRSETSPVLFDIWTDATFLTVDYIQDYNYWADSISNMNDTKIKVNIYDYYDTSAPLTTLTKFYQQDGGMEISLMEALGALTAQNSIRFQRTASRNDYLSAFLFDIIIERRDKDNIMVLSHRDMGEPLYVIKGKRKEPKEYTLEDYASNMKFLTERRVRNWNIKDDMMFDYISFMTTQKGDYVISYKYYDADDMLISSRNVTYPISTGVALRTIPVDLGNYLPENVHHVMVGLTYSTTATTPSDEIRYNVIDDYTPRRILAFRNGLGGCETYAFCDNRSNESLDRKASFSNIFTGSLTYDTLSRARRTINAETVDTYTLRTGVMPYEEAERLTWDLGNSLAVSVFDDEDGENCKPVVLTNLEIKFDSKNSNAIVELEYQYAY